MSSNYEQRNIDVADEHGRVFNAVVLTSLSGDPEPFVVSVLLGAPADDLGLPLPDKDGVADLWRRARMELES